MLTVVGSGMGDYNFKNISLNIKQQHKNETISELFDALFLGLPIGQDLRAIYILKNYDKQNILYVVTGNPLFFSAGILIAKQLSKDRVKIITNTSSKEYIKTKLLISDTQIDSLSLHARDRIDLTKFLTNRYTFILCDRFSIDRIQNATKFLNMQDIQITIGYKLGYDDEIIARVNPEEIKSKFDLKEPYVIVIERLFEKRPPSIDDEFKTQRGMITKEYKRNLSLQNLNLEPNQILWDIGAGSGSCGIEAYKRYKVKTVFFENKPKRVENIKFNLAYHRVVDCELLKGDAQDFFTTIDDTPQRIFIGGGGEMIIKKIPKLYKILDNDGIILINLVTLKHLSKIISILEKNSIRHEVESISITSYKGKLKMPQTQRELFWVKIVK